MKAEGRNSTDLRFDTPFLLLTERPNALSLLCVVFTTHKFVVAASNLERQLMEAKLALAATGPTSKSPSKVFVTAAEREWDAQFQSLLEFKKKNGHCLVPKVCPDNKRLSYWVFRQRQ